MKKRVNHFGQELVYTYLCFACEKKLASNPVLIAWIKICFSATVWFRRIWAAPESYLVLNILGIKNLISPWSEWHVRSSWTIHIGTNLQSKLSRHERKTLSGRITILCQTYVSLYCCVNILFTHLQQSRIEYDHFGCSLLSKSPKTHGFHWNVFWNCHN